jgi:hypothetical protein
MNVGWVEKRNPTPVDPEAVAALSPYYFDAVASITISKLDTLI